MNDLFVFIGQFIADLGNEAEVSGACRSGSRNLRFSIPLAGIPSGASLWAYGISPYGGTHNLLEGSGAFRVP